jgi:hypothetical protein
MWPFDGEKEVRPVVRGRRWAEVGERKRGRVGKMGWGDDGE